MKNIEEFRKKKNPWNKAGNAVLLLLISLIVLLSVAIPPDTWGGGSENMCYVSGCHGAIYEEYTDLLPFDPLSELVRISKLAGCLNIIGNILFRKPSLRENL